MAHNLFVSYDLLEPGKDYSKVIEAIKALGNWAKVHYSLWYVKSTLPPAEARDRVWKSMDSTDRLIVIDASTTAWQNLDGAVSSFMRDNWNS